MRVSLILGATLFCPSDGLYFLSTRACNSLTGSRYFLIWPSVAGLDEAISFDKSGGNTGGFYYAIVLSENSNNFGEGV